MHSFHSLILATGYTLFPNMLIMICGKAGLYSLMLRGEKVCPEIRCVFKGNEPAQYTHQAICQKNKFR